MHIAAGKAPRGREEAPWFLRQPTTAIAISVALFAGIFVLRVFFGDAKDAISYLYVFPIALVAMARGRAGGLMAGAVAAALIVAWVQLDSVELTVLGWVSRLLPMLLVGLLLGDASERLERAASDREAHHIAVQRQKEAVEINDTLVQGMAMAKWAIEAGRTETGLRTLQETVELGHQLVSQLIKESNGGFGVGSANGAGAQAPPATPKEEPAQPPSSPE